METIKVPDSWADIKIGQYQEILELDPKASDYSLMLTAILLNKQADEIKEYSRESVVKIEKHLEWVAKAPNDGSYKQLIEVEGVEYRLCENLSKFTGGQWWDMEEYMTNPNKNMHYILAMLYSDGYDSKKCKALGDMFAEKVSIEDTRGAMVFFWTLVLKSTIIIQESLLKESLTKLKTMINYSENGTGTVSFME